jgi:hypothetical protein
VFPVWVIAFIASPEQDNRIFRNNAIHFLPVFNIFDTDLVIPVGERFMRRLTGQKNSIAMLNFNSAVQKYVSG